MYLYKCLCAILSGILCLIGVYYVWRRDERIRKNEFVYFHYDLQGYCDYITYGGRKFYPESERRWP